MLKVTQDFQLLISQTVAQHRIVKIRVDRIPYRMGLSPPFGDHYLLSIHDKTAEERNADSLEIANLIQFVKQYKPRAVSADL